MYKVVWLSGVRPDKTCQSEAAVWAELGKSWACYHVYNEDGTLAAQFIPF